MYNYLRMGYYLVNLLRHTHWKPERLQDYRDARVREIVKYAYGNVHFYHEKFQQLGLKPKDIKTIEDLNKIPIIRREELQEKAENLVSREFDRGKLKAVSTSGSTGRPLFTYLTRPEDEFRKAKLLRPHIVCGQKPRDRWVLIEPVQHIRHLGRFHRFLSVYVPSFVSIFDEPDAQVLSIEKRNPDVLDGYSNSLFLIAKETEKMGVETIRPRLIMGGAELIDAASRKFIEESFEAPFFDQYASEEFQMMAWQCPEKDKYHIDADTVVLQFVDEEGNEVAAGERGELVCTSLFNYAMPFLRYALGDLGIRSTETDCPCGRTFPLMKMVEGRKDSMVTLPSGRRVPALVFGWMMEFFKFYRNIYQYRIIQGKRNLLRVLIRKMSENPSEAEMETELLSHMKKTLGICEPEVTIQVEFVDDIPFDKSGKLRKVISEI